MSLPTSAIATGISSATVVLGAVGPDVTLSDGEVLAVPALSAKEAGEGRETDPDEGRTGRAILPQAGIGGSESWTQADWNTQLRLAL